MSKIEYANTISGIRSKISELRTHLKRLDGERKKVTNSIACLEEALREFVEPEIDVKRYKATRSKKHNFTDFLREHVRASDGPLRTGDVAIAWHEFKGVAPTEFSLNKTRTLALHRFKRMTELGLLRELDIEGRGKAWEVVR